MATGGQPIAAEEDWFGFAELTDETIKSDSNTMSNVAPVFTVVKLKPVLKESGIKTMRDIIRDENEVRVPIVLEKHGVTKYKVLARQKVEDDEDVAEKDKVADNVYENEKRKIITAGKEENILVSNVEQRNENVKEIAKSCIGGVKADKTYLKSDLTIRIDKSAKLKLSGLNKNRLLHIKSLKKIRKIEVGIKKLEETENQNSFLQKRRLVTNLNVQADAKALNYEFHDDSDENLEMEKSKSITIKPEAKKTVAHKHINKKPELKCSKHTKKRKVGILPASEMDSNTLVSPCPTAEKALLKSKKLEVKDGKPTVSEKDAMNIIQPCLVGMKQTTSPISKCRVALKRDPSIDSMHKLEECEAGIAGTDDAFCTTKSNANLKRKLSERDIKQSSLKHSSSDENIGRHCFEVADNLMIKRLKSLEDGKPKLDMVFDVDIEVRKSGRLKSAKCASRYRGDYGIHADTYSKIVKTLKDPLSETVTSTTVNDLTDGGSIALPEVVSEDEESEDEEDKSTTREDADKNNENCVIGVEVIRDNFEDEQKDYDSNVSVSFEDGHCVKCVDKTQLDVMNKQTRGVEDNVLREKAAKKTEKALSKSVKKEAKTEKLLENECKSKIDMEQCITSKTRSKMSYVVLNKSRSDKKSLHSDLRVKRRKGNVKKRILPKVRSSLDLKMVDKSDETLLLLKNTENIEREKNSNNNNVKANIRKNVIEYMDTCGDADTQLPGEQLEDCTKVDETETKSDTLFYTDMVLEEIESPCCAHSSTKQLDEYASEKLTYDLITSVPCVTNIEQDVSHTINAPESEISSCNRNSTSNITSAITSENTYHQKFANVAKNIVESTVDIKLTNTQALRLDITENLTNMVKVLQIIPKVTTGETGVYQHSVGKSVNKRENQLEERKAQRMEEEKNKQHLLKNSPEASPEKINPIQVLENLRLKLFENAGANIQEADEKLKRFESKLISSKIKESLGVPKSESSNINFSLSESVLETPERCKTTDSCSNRSGRSTPRCVTPRCVIETNIEILDEVAETLNSMQKAKRKAENMKKRKVRKPKQKFEQKQFILRSMLKRNAGSGSECSVGIADNEIKKLKLTDVIHEGKKTDQIDTLVLDSDVKMKKIKEKLEQSTTDSDCNSLKLEHFKSITERKLLPSQSMPPPKVVNEDENKKEKEKPRLETDKKAPTKTKLKKCQACGHSFKSRELLRKHYPCRIRQTRTWSQNKLRPNRAFRRTDTVTKKDEKFVCGLPKSKSENKPRPQLLRPRKTKFRRVKGKRRRKLYQLLQELIEKRQPRKWPHLNLVYEDLPYKEQCFYKIGLLCIGNASEGLENYGSDDVAMFDKHRQKAKELLDDSINFQHSIPDLEDDTVLSERVTEPEISVKRVEVLSPEESSSSEKDLEKLSLAKSKCVAEIEIFGKGGELLPTDICENFTSVKKSEVTHITERRDDLFSAEISENLPFKNELDLNLTTAQTESSEKAAEILSPEMCEHDESEKFNFTKTKSVTESEVSAKGAKLLSSEISKTLSSCKPLVEHNTGNVRVIQGIETQISGGDVLLTKEKCENLPSKNKEDHKSSNTHIFTETEICGRGCKAFYPYTCEHLSSKSKNELDEFNLAKVRFSEIEVPGKEADDLSKEMSEYVPSNKALNSAKTRSIAENENSKKGGDRILTDICEKLPSKKELEKLSSAKIQIVTDIELPGKEAKLFTTQMRGVKSSKKGSNYSENTKCLAETESSRKEAEVLIPEMCGNYDSEEFKFTKTKRPAKSEITGKGDGLFPTDLCECLPSENVSEKFSSRKKKCVTETKELKLSKTECVAETEVSEKEGLSTEIECLTSKNELKGLHSLERENYQSKKEHEKLDSAKTKNSTEIEISDFSESMPSEKKSNKLNSVKTDHVTETKKGARLLPFAVCESMSSQKEWEMFTSAKSNSVTENKVLGKETKMLSSEIESLQFKNESEFNTSTEMGQCKSENESYSLQTKAYPFYVQGDDDGMQTDIYINTDKTLVKPANIQCDVEIAIDDSALANGLASVYKNSVRIINQNLVTETVNTNSQGNTSTSETVIDLQHDTNGSVKAGSVTEVQKELKKDDPVRTAVDAKCVGYDNADSVKKIMDNNVTTVESQDSIVESCSTEDEGLKMLLLNAASVINDFVESCNTCYWQQPSTENIYDHGSVNAEERNPAISTFQNLLLESEYDTSITEKAVKSFNNLLSCIVEDNLTSSSTINLQSHVDSEYKLDEETSEAYTVLEETDAEFDLTNDKEDAAFPNAKQFNTKLDQISRTEPALDEKTCNYSIVTDQIENCSSNNVSENAQIIETKETHLCQNNQGEIEHVENACLWNVQIAEKDKTTYDYQTAREANVVNKVFDTLDDVAINLNESLHSNLLKEDEHGVDSEDEFKNEIKDKDGSNKCGTETDGDHISVPIHKYETKTKLCVGQSWGHICDEKEPEIDQDYLTDFSTNDINKLNSNKTAKSYSEEDLKFSVLCDNKNNKAETEHLSEREISESQTSEINIENIDLEEEHLLNDPVKGSEGDQILATKMEEIEWTHACEGDQILATKMEEIDNKNLEAGKQDLPFSISDTHWNENDETKTNYIIKYELNGLVISENLLTGDKNIVRSSSQSDLSLTENEECLVSSFDTENEVKEKTITEGDFYEDDIKSEANSQNGLDESNVSSLDEVRLIDKETTDRMNAVGKNSNQTFKNTIKITDEDTSSKDETASCKGIKQFDNASDHSCAIYIDDTNIKDSEELEEGIEKMRHFHSGQSRKSEDVTTPNISTCDDHFELDGQEFIVSATEEYVNIRKPKAIEEENFLREENDTIPVIDIEMFEEKNVFSEQTEPIPVIDVEAPPILEKVESMNSCVEIYDSRLDLEDSQQSVSGPPVLEPELIPVVQDQELLVSENSNKENNDDPPVQKPRPERHFLDVLGEVCEIKELCVLGQASKQSEDATAELTWKTEKIPEKSMSLLDGLKQNDVSFKEIGINLVTMTEDIGRHFSDVMDNALDSSETPKSNVLLDKNEKGEVTLAQIKEILNSKSKTENLLSKESLLKLRSDIANLFSEVKTPIKKDPVWLKRDALSNCTGKLSNKLKKKKSTMEKLSEIISIFDSESSNDAAEESIETQSLDSQTQLPWSDEDIHSINESEIRLCQANSAGKDIDLPISKGTITDNILQMLTSFEAKGSLADNMSNLLDILASNLGFLGKTNKPDESEDTSESESENEEYLKKYRKNRFGVGENVIMEISFDSADEPPSLDDIPTAEDYFIQSDTETEFEPAETTESNESESEFESSDNDYEDDICQNESESSLDSFQISDQDNKLSHPSSAHEKDKFTLVQYDKSDKKSTSLKRNDSERIMGSSNKQDYSVNNSFIENKCDLLSQNNLEKAVNKNSGSSNSCNSRICEIIPDENSTIFTAPEFGKKSTPSHMDSDNSDSEDISRAINRYSKKSTKANTLFKSITELNSIETDEDSNMGDSFDAVSMSHRLSELKALSTGVSASDAGSDIFSDLEDLEYTSVDEEKIKNENRSKSELLKTVHTEEVLDTKRSKTQALGKNETDNSRNYVAAEDPAFSKAFEVKRGRETSEESERIFNKKNSVIVSDEYLNESTNISLEVMESEKHLMDDSEITATEANTSKWSDAEDFECLSDTLCREKTPHCAMEETEIVHVEIELKHIRDKPSIKTEVNGDQQDTGLLKDKMPKTENEKIEALTVEKLKVQSDTNCESDSSISIKPDAEVSESECENEDIFKSEGNENVKKEHQAISERENLAGNANAIEKAQYVDIAIKNIPVEEMEQYSKSEVKQYVITENGLDKNIHSNSERASSEYSSLNEEDVDETEYSYFELDIPEEIEIDLENNTDDFKYAISNSPSSKQHAEHREEYLTDLDKTPQPSSTSEDEKNEEDSCSTIAYSESEEDKEALPKIAYISKENETSELTSSKMSDIEILTLPLDAVFNSIAKKIEISKERNNSTKDDVEFPKTSSLFEDNKSSNYAGSESLENVVKMHEMDTVIEGNMALSEDHTNIIKDELYWNESFCETIAEKVKRKQRERPSKSLSLNQAWLTLSGITVPKSTPKEISIFRSAIMEKKLADRARAVSLPCENIEQKDLELKRFNSVPKEIKMTPCSVKLEPLNQQKKLPSTPKKTFDLKPCSVTLQKLDNSTIKRYIAKKKRHSAEERRKEARPPIKVTIKFNRIIAPHLDSHYTDNSSSEDEPSDESETESESASSVKQNAASPASSTSSSVCRTPDPKRLIDLYSNHNKIKESKDAPNEGTCNRSPIRLNVRALIMKANSLNVNYESDTSYSSCAAADLDQSLSVIEKTEEIEENYSKQKVPVSIMKTFVVKDLNLSESDSNDVENDALGIELGNILDRFEDAKEDNEVSTSSEISIEQILGDDRKAIKSDCNFKDVHDNEKSQNLIRYSNKTSNMCNTPSTSNETIGGDSSFRLIDQSVTSDKELKLIAKNVSGVDWNETNYLENVTMLNINQTLNETEVIKTKEIDTLTKCVAEKKVCQDAAEKCLSAKIKDNHTSVLAVKRQCNIEECNVQGPDARKYQEIMSDGTKKDVTVLQEEIINESAVLNMEMETFTTHFKSNVINLEEKKHDNVVFYAVEMTDIETNEAVSNLECVKMLEADVTTEFEHVAHLEYTNEIETETVQCTVEDDNEVPKEDIVCEHINESIIIHDEAIENQDLITRTENMKTKEIPINFTSDVEVESKYIYGINEDSQSSTEIVEECIQDSIDTIEQVIEMCPENEIEVVEASAEYFEPQPSVYVSDCIGDSPQYYAVRLDNSVLKDISETAKIVQKSKSFEEECYKLHLDNSGTVFFASPDENPEHFNWNTAGEKSEESALASKMKNTAQKHNLSREQENNLFEAGQ